jgi:hypothetical protein
MKFKQKLLVAGAVMVPILGGGSLAYATTSGASTGTAPVTAPTPGAEAPDAAEVAGPSSETTPASGTDAPGGHQDPAGSSVDHQAQGQE